MSERYDVAIVGGGAVGWSSAWHLLTASPRLHLVVFDPDGSRCTSLRGAGGFRAQFSSPINIAMSLASIPELMRFERDTGTNVGARQNGYLLATGNPDRAAALQELSSMQRQHGVQIETPSLEEAAAMVPSLNTEGLIHFQLGLQDGFLDGPALRNGYREAALRLGATEIREQVTGIYGEHVQTSAQEWSATNVVVAAGHWSGSLGLGLPIKPEKHQLYFVEGRLPESTPFTIDLDTTFHYRPYGEQVLVCFNDPELASHQCEPDEPPTFDESVLDRLLPIAEHRAPGLMVGKTVTGRAGYYGVTPDRHPTLGRLGDIVVAAGFGGHGVMHSPAAGIVVSEIVLDGESKTVDVSELSPTRFESGKLLQESWVF